MERLGRSRAPGQVLVELLLVLPLFLLMVFFIMELGYIAFQQIITTHAAYECARIGAMTAGGVRPSATGGISEGRGRGQAAGALRKMITTAKIKSFRKVETIEDIQTGLPNFDLVVEIENEVKLIFPFSSYFLANPRRSGKRKIMGMARMPIEVPLPWTIR